MSKRPQTELWCYRLLLTGAAGFAIVHFWGPSFTSKFGHGWFSPIGLVPAAIVALWLLAKLPGRSGPWVALVAAGAVHLVLVLPRIRSDAPVHRPSCQAHLKILTLACRQYLDDYDGRLPEFEQRWSDALLPYLKVEQWYQCPSLRLTGEQRRTIPLTYGLNPNLVGHDLRPVGPIDRVILFYCGDDAGPLMRHLEGANYSYLDGHVRWVKSGQDPGLWNPWEQAP